MGKFEMHLHTAECDKVAQVGGAEAVKMYCDIGYEGMVVTDHYFSLFYKWFEGEIKNAEKRNIVERWMKGYYSARNEGEKHGFTVLLGAEVRFDGAINDYLVYGADEEVFLRTPLLNQLSGVEELIAILPKECCVVQAHPFRNGMTVYDPNPLFGIESYNGGTHPIRNELAKSFASYYKKPMLSGSDFHDKTALGRGGIFTKEPIKSSADLVEILRKGEYSLIENGLCKAWTSL